MGEVRGRRQRLKFNTSVRVETREERLSEHTGALLVREAFQRSGTLRLLESRLEDRRCAARVTHPLGELVLTRVACIALGAKDQDDADVLRADAALRLAVSKRRGDAPLRNDPTWAGRANPPVPQGLASQPTHSRLVGQLATTHNRGALGAAVRHQAGSRLLRANGGRRYKRLTLDFDGFPIPVEGHQSGAAYNGYYQATVFHPLVAVVGETGDIVGVRLRRGNAAAGQDLVEFVREVVGDLVGRVCESVLLRLDAGMVSDEVLRAFESAGLDYLARVRNNARLDAEAAPFVRRPAGRRPAAPREWVHDLDRPIKADTRARRVVLVVQERENDLYLHHFWLVTSLTSAQRDAPTLLECYRRRGCAEAHIGELSDVLAPRLSSALRGVYSVRPSERIGPIRAEDQPDFGANEATLLLHVLAYGALHALRGELPPQQSGERWSLRRLREQVLCVAGRVLLHARRVTVVLTTRASAAWDAITRRLQPRSAVLPAH